LGILPPVRLATARKNNLISFNFVYSKTRIILGPHFFNHKMGIGIIKIIVIQQAALRWLLHHSYFTEKEKNLIEIKYLPQN